MKGLIWNCKTVAWKNGEKLYKKKNNCLLVYICCESGDKGKQIKQTVRRIIQLNNKRYNKNKVIIFPFAHLSNNIMPGHHAKEIMLNISEMLQRTSSVSVMDFNVSKEVKIHLLPENKDVSYFSY
ncbi:hypothetical protein A2955_05355 [Candidatus Woesebacteria bacterium RIFCSPLOWO2_01_FULL_37_19]|uniref:Threonyl-tRNA synthetase editing domain-containing protein n=2 Tax=Candidatus Woeseibacteriota TaxID=1752722 RepID=A0A1F8B5G0_9BACT|nr:MAG: hypothetical protein A2771_04500 [Candidatus Woesebacteria bacterium RIFCSPHIGHO2_01_FULL_38_26b]OGM59251.1 MAG: hypothetical protein A2955_05355 [Candidatus Woesebacteria bacterium RIFCSPLOWO2_01_FULL_37_19]